MAEVEVVAERVVTISDRKFVVPSRFGVGHVLTAGEANALNAYVAATARASFTPRAIKLLSAEPPASAEVLQEEFAAFINNFDLNSRRTYARGEGGDAVAIAKIALNLAKNLVKAGIKKKGISLKRVPAGKLEELAKELLARTPKIHDEAVRAFAEQQAIFEGEVGEVEVPQAEAA